MTAAGRGIAVCPHCHRSVATNHSRYVSHREVEGEESCCPATGMHVPYRSDQQSATDYVGRAHIVANLAADLQDSDPAVVWSFLTALPANELQRLTMLALAAVPVDKPFAEIWGWVYELPAAKTALAHKKLPPTTTTQEEHAA